MFASLLLALAVGSTVNVAHRVPRPGDLRQALPLTTGVHLSVVLRPGDPEGLAAFLRAVSDPASSSYRRFLTPAEFGARFGAAEADYARVAGWLRAAGFEVQAVPGRTYLGATGTAAEVKALLGVELHAAVTARGVLKRTLVGTPRAPDAVAAQVLLIDGLDTEPVWHRHLLVSGTGQTVMGPQDLRQFYEMQPLLAQGVTGRGTHLATMLPITPNGVPSQEVVQYFYTQLANSSAQYIRDILPNPGDESFVSGDGDVEACLDAEMLSIAVPGAATITTVATPYETSFSSGFSEVVNNLPETDVVSLSYGGCEAEAAQSFPDLANGLTAIETLLQQGLAEGIAFLAAAGDDGAADCGDGTLAVDFPGSLPEFLSVGGTQVTSAVFDANEAISAYQEETVWNAAEEGAGGGGSSILFSKPSWQVGVTPNDGARDVPDLSMLAGAPTTAFFQYIDELLPGDGTSNAAPLAASVLALIVD